MDESFQRDSALSVRNFAAVRHLADVIEARVASRGLGCFPGNPLVAIPPSARADASAPQRRRAAIPSFVDDLLAQAGAMKRNPTCPGFIYREEWGVDLGNSADDRLRRAVKTGTVRVLAALSFRDWARQNMAAASIHLPTELSGQQVLDLTGFPVWKHVRTVSLAAHALADAVDPLDERLRTAVNPLWNWFLKDVVAQYKEEQEEAQQHVAMTGGLPPAWHKLHGLERWLAVMNPLKGGDMPGLGEMANVRGGVMYVGGFLGGGIFGSLRGYNKMPAKAVWRLKLNSALNGAGQTASLMSNRLAVLALVGGFNQYLVCSFRGVNDHSSLATSLGLTSALAGSLRGPLSAIVFAALGYAFGHVSGKAVEDDTLLEYGVFQRLLGRDYSRSPLHDRFPMVNSPLFASTVQPFLAEPRKVVLKTRTNPYAHSARAANQSILLSGKGSAGQTLWLGESFESS